MRIIAGEYKSRIIKSPRKRSTHPMSEKIRGAIFNSMGDISGLTIFDPYAGSGAIGFEALSRGAKSVLACEVEGKAFDVIKENAEKLGLDELKFKVVQANCVTYIKNNPNEFDIIFCDPPYYDVRPNQLDKISKHVARGGLFILSLPLSEVSLEFDGFSEVSSKKYGNAQIKFLKKLALHK